MVESRQQELGAAGGHMTSAVRRKRVMDALWVQPFHAYVVQDRSSWYAVLPLQWSFQFFP